MSGGGLGELFPSTGPTAILDDSTIVPLLKTKDHWTDFSPEITVSYKPVPNVNIFGSYKQGFLSGGFNSSSSSFSTAPNLDLSYNPQTIEGFEAGIKTELFNRRLFLNLAAYTYKVDDLQVSQFTNATSTIRNAGAVKVKGVEADFTYRTPVDGLTIRGSGAYNKGKYSSFPNAPCYNGQPVGPDSCFLGSNGGYVQNLDGTELIRAPKWNWSAGFDYATPIGDDLKFGLSGGLNYTSSFLTDASSAPQSRMPSFTLVDASARIGAADDRWELALIGKNLTNEWIFVASPNVPFTGSNPGVVPEVLGDRFAAIGRGREIMIRASFKY
jgi:iron complex outermembrane receptor protein